MKKTITALLISLAINNSAFSDSLLVNKTDDGKVTIWLNEKYMRLTFTEEKQNDDSPAPPADMITNFSSGKTYMINHKDKVLLDTSSAPMFSGGMMPEREPASNPDILYTRKGAGETIAGLKTTRYEVSIKGKKCFDMWLTKDSAYTRVIKKIDSAQGGGGRCIWRYM